MSYFPTRLLPPIDITARNHRPRARQGLVLSGEGEGVAMWSGHGDNTLDRDQSSRLSGTHFEPSVDVAEVDEESRLVFDACSCSAVGV